MKSGTALGIGFALTAIGAAAAIYYIQNIWFSKIDDGRESVRIGGQDFAVSGYRGIDHPSLPQRLRGCFQFEEPAAARAAAPEAKDAVPFDAPSWFDCWDAAEIDADLKAGRAAAVLAEPAGTEDFAAERIVVVYPDGRGFQWRRLKSE